MLDTQQCVTMACMLDVTVPKPGNVHRGADFADMTFLDFAASAVAVGPHIARAGAQRVGRTVLDAIQATREVTTANTNLGIVLLLVPLAAVADENDPRDAMNRLLSSLTPEDGRNVFEAIRLAAPGGLGSVQELDVHQESVPTDLMHAMALARGRDRIAESYVTRFRLIFDELLPMLVNSCQKHGIVDGLIASYVRLLANYPDTLIRRKCGEDLANEASRRASLVTGSVGSEEWFHSLKELDFWLRADGNRRNPGTTADLVTAAMFMALNSEQIKLLNHAI